MAAATARLTVGATAISAKGIMIAITTNTKLAYKAADSANYVVVGVNSETAAASGSIVAKSGVYGFTNSATYPVTQAHIGSDCYVENEYTVSSSGGSNSIEAGKVVDVDSNYVWVAVGVAA
jgi:hypothetical protein